MIAGIGVDICDIRRVAKILEKKYSQNFKKKIFSDNEIDYCDKIKNSAPHFAVRWAVREAFYKALPEELQAFSFWKSIEFINADDKKPFIRVIDRELAKKLNDSGISGIHCSVSHEKEFCIAQVILEKP